MVHATQVWRVLGLGGLRGGKASPKLGMEASGSPFWARSLWTPSKPFLPSSAQQALLSEHNGPQSFQGTSGHLRPPQLLAQPCHLSAGSSVILNVVSLENQRLTCFRLPCLLVVLALKLGQARVAQPLFQGLSLA